MTTKDTQKLNRLEREVKILKSFVSNLVPYDKEGEYKDSFLKQIKNVAREKSEFTYKGKGSLIEKFG
jgi:hypothetical protein